MQNSRQAIKERRQQRKRQQRITTILIISGVALIVAALLMIPTIQEALTPVGEIVHPELFSRPMVSGNAMGDPDAPVVIVDYSDFGCGHCANFAAGTELQIANEYVASGQVYFVYRSVGGLLGSATSQTLAEAAYCAGDQEKFWEFHDFAYANQNALYSSANAPVEKYIASFAEALDLEMSAFDDCLSGRQYKDRVQQDQLDAVQAGINSTPSFTVNGELLVGNRSFGDFQTAINAALSE
jgi:protein-disulfide isomerase